MKFLIVLVVYIFVQFGFQVTEARGGRGGGRGGTFRGSGAGRPVVRRFNSVERLSSRYIMFHAAYRGGGGYILSGHSSDECLPPLDAYEIKEFVDVTKDILKIGRVQDEGIELAEQFMTLDPQSSIQTWFDLTLKLFNIHTTRSDLNQILGIEIPRNPIDDNLSKVFSADNNEEIRNALSGNATTPEDVEHLITYLRVFNANCTNSSKSFYSLTVPGIEICYSKYKQIINLCYSNLVDIFPSLGLLEHSMCRSGAGGKSFIDNLAEGGRRSDNSLKTLPRIIKLNVDEEYYLSGHDDSECLPPLDAYEIKQFVNVTKNILSMGGSTDEVIDLAEQFMKLDAHSSIQTWFDLTLRLFNVITIPLNLTSILDREIPDNPLDDNLYAFLSAETTDRIENALPNSFNVRDLMDYLRGFNDNSYMVWNDYGTDICYEKYNKIVNPSDESLTDIFPSLATLRDSMCRQGARQRTTVSKIANSRDVAKYSSDTKVTASARDARLANDR